MNNQLIPFSYNSKQVRTVIKDDEPWFVAVDVCDILDISNANMAVARLDDDEVSQTEVTDSIGRTQNTNIINEMGLYNLILRSDKPQAKPFRKWVTGEVLPSIRKTGGYNNSKLTPKQALEIARIIHTAGKDRLPALKSVFAYAGINIELSDRNNIRSQIAKYFKDTNLRGTVKAAIVYKDYQKWCKYEGCIPVTPNMLGRTITTCGIGRHKTREAKFYTI